MHYRTIVMTQAHYHHNCDKSPQAHYHHNCNKSPLHNVIQVPAELFPEKQVCDCRGGHARLGSKYAVAPSTVVSTQLHISRYSMYIYILYILLA